MAGGKRKLTTTDSDEGISLQDVIAEDEEMKNAADAVLGAANTEECTYSKGYMQRQALYACATCTVRGDGMAGVCLACSIECHDGHDLYELYTKRGFRCDCGNRKFVDRRCRLNPGKEKLNTKNKYSQNFKGLYCNCHRPYPDPEDDVEDEMIQCVVCEDWYHGRHLGSTTVPANVEYHEMICFDCSVKCTFIARYSHMFAHTSAIQRVTPSSEGDEVVDVEGDTATVNNKGGEGASSSSKTQAPSDCSVADRRPTTVTGATFWRPQWRQSLCRCDKCTKLYSELEVEFLLDEHDTVRHYEEQGKLQSNNNNEMNVSTALQGMSRTTQIEMIHGYNEMKDGLSDFLRSFAESGEVVSSEDIQEFFRGLSNKRQKLDLSYSCR